LADEIFKNYLRANSIYMRYSSLKSYIILLGLVAGLSLSACKDKEKETTDTTINSNPDSSNATTVSPEISTDAALEQGLKDATKDYPGVTATVSNGEVTLTGTIEKDKVPTLLQSVNGLNPKKVNNQLTYK
jgi:osmotically-inducible protein OsmY